MYIVNPESLNEEALHFCDNEQIADYLIGQGFMYVAKIYNSEDKPVLWIFSKTEELLVALKEVS